MISYNINLRMNTDGKIYMPYSEALIGTYWPDAVQLVIAEEMGMKPEDVIVYYAANYPNWQKGDAADRGSTCTWAAKEAAIQLKKQILETGMVEILDYCSAHDFGKLIRPSSGLGQLEMALTMASGRALREEIIWDPGTGVLLNGNMYDYKVPTSLDQPPIDPVPVETRCGGGAYGSTGVAHAHCDAGLVGLAIQNAIGKFIPMAPYTPDKILAAMGTI